ncbi:hypothetical protein HIM_02314 [Hirsutella minnesotensis 3608]|nr:hypothetical protein HIM_02314 [Hirsutella minnesotensis 3608]
MDRRLHTPRIASGILFARPADPSKVMADVRPGVNDKSPRKLMEKIGEYLEKPYNPEIWKLTSSSQWGSDPITDLRAAARPAPSDDINGGWLEFPVRQRPSRPQSPPFSTPDSKLRSIESSADPEDPEVLCLPVVQVTADVTIDGTIASTELVQEYYNPSEIAILEARHSFPVYDGAVITSFECTIGDTRWIRGVVKPKKQARQEFEEAKRDKTRAAALLEEQTPEMFVTSLGNIPPQTTIRVTLTYVHELKAVTMETEKAEGLALTIPTSVAPKCSGSLVSPRSTRSQGNSLSIWVRVMEDDTINPDGCHVESDHETTYEGIRTVKRRAVESFDELARLSLDPNVKPQTQLVWHHASHSPVLKRDFILVLQMRQRHRLCSRAVLGPADDRGYGALMVSIRPNDLFGSAVRPSSFSGEILFVLDQSASMGWTEGGINKLKIDVMRSAMLFALAGLPPTCAYNVVSFGSEVRGMWRESRAADNPGNARDARAYIAHLDADMGGTEVLLALDACVEHRSRARKSTQIIMVTDGEVGSERTEKILEFVWETRRRLGDRIRFFTLGIGDRVSHRVIEGIASFGGGYCDVIDVVKKPRWDDRLNRMLRSAMEPDSWRCEVSLGPNFVRQNLESFQFGTDKLEDPSLVPFAQGPYPVPALHPYSYRSLFFLLDLKTGEPPSTVTVKTTTSGAKEKTYTLPVSSGSVSTAALHHMTARAVLSSLDDQVKIAGSESDMARRNAEALGIAYSISSKWTSFVAVADNEADHHVDVYKCPISEMGFKELLHPGLEDDFEAMGDWNSPMMSPCDIASNPARVDWADEWSDEDLLVEEQAAPSAQNPLEKERDASPMPIDVVVQGSFPDVSEPHSDSSSWEEADYDSSFDPEMGSSILAYLSGGLFVLPEAIRTMIFEHFCPGTFEHLQAAVARLAKGDRADLKVPTDTMMTMHYLMTHFATTDDIWSLLVDNVERVVLLSLGFEEDDETALEPVKEILATSMGHVHWIEAVKEAAIMHKGRDEAHGSRSSSAACPVCGERYASSQTSGGAGYEFSCRDDECFDDKKANHQVWDSWDTFWEHQVTTGHLLCPENVEE